jgi:hypothetical protein
MQGGGVQISFRATADAIGGNGTAGYYPCAMICRCAFLTPHHHVVH